MKKDVLLLADVFEKFICTSLKNYSLDPCHYFSARGISWYPMLKMTKIELEKNSNPDINFLLKKEGEQVLVISIKGIVKQITSIVKIMIKKNL